MLGIVFTSLIDMLEDKVSPEFADEVIVEANLTNDGAYTAVGYYPFEEMQKIVGILVQKTGKSANDLLRDFGYYLFGKLSTVHGDVLAGADDVLHMLEYLDGDIHVQVRKLYPTLICLVLPLYPVPTLQCACVIIQNVSFILWLKALWMELPIILIASSSGRLINSTHHTPMNLV